MDDDEREMWEGMKPGSVALLNGPELTAAGRKLLARGLVELVQLTDESILPGMYGVRLKPSPVSTDEGTAGRPARDESIAKLVAGARGYIDAIVLGTAWNARETANEAAKLLDAAANALRSETASTPLSRCTCFDPCPEHDSEHDSDPAPAERPASEGSDTCIGGVHEWQGSVHAYGPGQLADHFRCRCGAMTAGDFRRIAHEPPANREMSIGGYTDQNIERMQRRLAAAERPQDAQRSAECRHEYRQPSDMGRCYSCDATGLPYAGAPRSEPAAGGDWKPGEREKVARLVGHAFAELMHGGPRSRWAGALEDAAVILGEYEREDGGEPAAGERGEVERLREVLTAVRDDAYQIGEECDEHHGTIGELEECPKCALARHIEAALQPKGSDSNGR
jgi:hypothetical protein